MARRMRCQPLASLTAVAVAEVVARGEGAERYHIHAASTAGGPIMPPIRATTGSRSTRMTASSVIATALRTCPRSSDRPAGLTRITVTVAATDNATNR